jgi:hypothetical protein
MIIVAVNASMLRGCKLRLLSRKELTNLRFLPSRLSMDSSRTYTPRTRTSEFLPRQDRTANTNQSLYSSVTTLQPLLRALTSTSGSIALTPCESAGQCQVAPVHVPMLCAPEVVMWRSWLLLIAGKLPTDHPENALHAVQL